MKATQKFKIEDNEKIQNVWIPIPMTTPKKTTSKISKCKNNNALEPKNSRPRKRILHTKKRPNLAKMTQNNHPLDHVRPYVFHPCVHYSVPTPWSCQSVQLSFINMSTIWIVTCLNILYNIFTSMEAHCNNFNTPSKDLQGSYWILSHLQEENVTLTRA